MKLKSKHIGLIVGLGISVFLIYILHDNLVSVFEYVLFASLILGLPFMAYIFPYEKYQRGDLKKVVFISMFCSVLFAPIVMQLKGYTQLDDLYPSFQEKRALRSFPVFSLDSISSYPDQFTNYFNDNFFGRKSLIVSNNYIKAFGFGVSSKPQVIIGKNDWMFFDSEGSLADHQGKLRLTEEELKQLKEALVQRKTCLDSLGIEYYVVICPDKMSVYPEFLPRHIETTNSTRIDQLITYMESTKVNLIDLREVLRKHSKQHLLYQKNDSHWNMNGGFFGAQEIVRLMRLQDPSILPPFSISDFKVSKVEIPAGDLATYLGIRDLLKNSDFHYESKQQLSPVSLIEDTLYNFYTEGYKQTFIHENEDRSLPRLISFNDSYVSYIHDFLSQHFSRSTFIWSLEMREDIIKNEQPDIVIQMLVERDIKFLVEP